jgi:NTP pyrophosphatase (non-canonical NTP hydrolase)
MKVELMSSSVPRVTVSGSFRKFRTEIGEVIRELKAQGIEVAAPRTTEPTEESNGFVRLVGDTGSEKDLEEGHLRAVLSSDLLYVVDPGGYIGSSTTLEVGAAIAASIPVYTLAPPKDLVLAQLTKMVGPSQVKHVLSNNGTSLLTPASIPHLQKHILATAQRQGFSDESARDLVLMLIEEVGELARVVRKESGLAYREVKGRKYSIESEIADCFILLLSIANRRNIDLATAVAAAAEKSRKNEGRHWSKDTAAAKDSV